MICTVDVDKLHRKGPGYRKLNVSFLTHQDFRDRVSKLFHRELMGAIINKRSWITMKTAIRVAALEFSKELAIEKACVEGGLVRKLENAFRKYITTDVLAPTLARDQFFNAKHEVCVVRTRVSALKREETKAQVAEIQRRNKATIQSSTLLDSKQMCATF